MRDNQRQRVYNAERPVQEKFGNERIEDIHALTKYVEKICKSSWYKRRFPRSGIVRVKDGRRCRRASGGWGTINMPRWSRCKMIVLHEMAHAVQTVELSGPQAWHGREFAKIYLAFVKKWLGKEAYEALKASFKEHGVKYVTGRVKV